MNITRQLATASVLSLALAAAAHAQGGGSGSGAPGGGPATGTRPAQEATPGTGAAGSATMSRKANDAQASHPLTMARLSDIEGTDMYDSNNKKIGEIEDVLVDAKTGAIRQVVVQTGGIAGVGGKKHAAALSDLKFFSKAADDNEPAKVTSSKAADTLPAAETRGKEAGLVSYDSYLDMNVVDSSGKKIGEIEDVVVDLSSGQASYALVEFDRSFWSEDKLVAFKPDQLSAGQGDKTLRVNTTREQLSQMPSMDKDALERSDLSKMPTAAR